MKPDCYIGRNLVTFGGLTTKSKLPPMLTANLDTTEAYLHAQIVTVIST